MPVTNFISNSKRGWNQCVETIVEMREPYRGGTKSHFKSEIFRNHLVTKQPVNRLKRHRLGISRQFQIATAQLGRLVLVTVDQSNRAFPIVATSASSSVNFLV